ncbi:MAG: Tex family protein [Butyricicoccaceae bacterium]
MEQMIRTLAEELNQPARFVENVVQLVDEGNTIPFIARYRKELHGGMDDTTLRSLFDRLNYLRGLAARKEEVKKAIGEKLTPELEQAIEHAATLAVVEDLYRPYKQKRRTRATVAKEKGLEPLAMKILLQVPSAQPSVLAQAFLAPEKGVETTEDALNGASDILAEMISDNAEVRSDLREQLQKSAMLTVCAAKEEDSVYRMYYDFSRPIHRLQGHQVLAINRGEKEGFLKVSVVPDEERALRAINRRMIRGNTACGAFLRAAAEDSWHRLLFPSLEREIRSALTESASEGAIHNFALNLRPLLLQPPVRGKVIMGLDPGYAHGCKVAVINETGKVLDTTVVYPTSGERRRRECIAELKRSILRHRVQHLAIGNGTASRETEAMAIELIRECGKAGQRVTYMIVNESGASVYSASRLAAEEFPQYDVNLRSAVSIARRLQDPLAELVKIDPKAIGVGQYQHDMPQKRLDEALNGVVEDCVNHVGVDVNTASPSLLRRVAGLTAVTAKNITAYREENGAFTSRKQLLKVPKLGPKAYQQCAGFLRVPESENVLDHTGVHPESYSAAQKLLDLCGFTLQDVAEGHITTLPLKLKSLRPERIAEQCGIGQATIEDIVKELLKPGRDPRDELPQPILRSDDVMELKDLKPGMQLMGTVRNVIDFGAFVDIGVHQDGLVHISEIADQYLRHPSEVLHVGDVVPVIVLDVDEKKKRISLSIRQAKTSAK